MLNEDLSTVLTLAPPKLGSQYQGAGLVEFGFWHAAFPSSNVEKHADTQLEISRRSINATQKIKLITLVLSVSCVDRRVH